MLISEVWPTEYLNLTFLLTTKACTNKDCNNFRANKASEKNTFPLLKVTIIIRVLERGEKRDRLFFITPKIGYFLGVITEAYHAM